MTVNRVNKLESFFVVVGPQRTSSSWLDSILRQHPDITMPHKVKETFFFDCFYDRGDDWYRSQFPSRGLIFGEVAPTCFDDLLTIDRIRSFSARVKIIILVRDPIERAISSFRHHYSKGRVSNVFRSAVKEEPRILEAGRYSEYVHRWVQSFGKENVLVIYQSELISSDGKALSQLFEFLGVNVLPLSLPSFERVGSSDVPRFLLVARVSSKIAKRIRGLGLHSIVNFLKSLGLKKIYSGGNQDRLIITNNDLNFLQDYYKADFQYLEREYEIVFK
jgi:hypothetical protein